ncbi:MAG: hypothetical protein OXH68_07345 [Gammaproteobacteria bacterium]|nr:hypothetical protein [Gammaproteobacteria bacterium]
MSRPALAASASRTYTFVSADLQPLLPPRTPGRLQPGHRALADKLTLELGQGRNETVLPARHLTQCPT